MEDKANQNFEISFGEEIPKNPADKLGSEVPEVQKQINSNNVLLDHWQKCKWRSDKHEYEQKGCCGHSSIKVIGYKCFRLELSALTPIICQRCNFFQNKELI